MKDIMKVFKASSDMTVGDPLKTIVTFMIPMLIGNIAQQMYSTVDSIIVGQFVGDNALAAVGSTGAIFNLLLVLFVGISVGASIIVSQYFGARDKENISHSVGCCMVLTAIATVLLMVGGAFVSRPLLEMLNTPDAIIDWSVTYLNIMFIGVGGMAYYNILCGIMRGLGDSISPLKYLIFATGLNIVLDLLFVAVFDMGVAGVAYATVIAQYMSAVLCVRKMFRMKDIFDLDLKHLRCTKARAKTIIKMGLPSGLTQMIFSLAMVIMQPLTNSHGAMLIAANVIVMRVDGFAMMPNMSFGSAMTTFSGQNIGANQYDRVLKGAKKGTMVAIATSTTITALILLFGRNLVSIFTDTPELIELSMRMLTILAVGYIAMSITQSLSGVMRGAGDTLTPMWISLITTVVIRVPLAYIWTYATKTPEMPNGDISALFGSLVISWIAGAVITVILYKRGKWKNKAINQNHTPTKSDELCD